MEQSGRESLARLGESARAGASLVRGAAIAFAGAVGLGGVLLLGAWLLIPLFVGKPASEVNVPAVVSPAVRNAPTARVNVPSVKVYAGDTKARLKLPPDALASPTEHVTSAVRVPAGERPSTVTTTIDERTGESRTFVKADPYPWFAVETRGEARLMAGVKMQGVRAEPVVRLQVSYDVVRVKALTIGATTSLDSDGAGFIGVGVSYRW